MRILKRDFFFWHSADPSKHGRCSGWVAYHVSVGRSERGQWSGNNIYVRKESCYTERSEHLNILSSKVCREMCS